MASSSFNTFERVDDESFDQHFDQYFDHHFDQQFEQTFENFSIGDHGEERKRRKK